MSQITVHKHPPARPEGIVDPFARTMRVSAIATQSSWSYRRLHPTGTGAYQAAPAAGVDEPGSTQRLSCSVVKVSRACLEGRGESLARCLASASCRETVQNSRGRAATSLQTNSAGRLCQCEADDASVPEILPAPRKTAETRSSSVMSQLLPLPLVCVFSTMAPCTGVRIPRSLFPSVPRGRGRVHIYIDRTLDVGLRRFPTSRERPPNWRRGAQLRRSRVERPRAGR